MFRCDFVAAQGQRLGLRQADAPFANAALAPSHSPLSARRRLMVVGSIRSAPPHRRASTPLWTSLVNAAASSSGVKFCRCRFSTVAMRSVSSLDRLSRISTATGEIPVHFAALLQEFQGAVAAFAADDAVMLAFALHRPDDKVLQQAVDS